MKKFSTSIHNARQNFWLRVSENTQLPPASLVVFRLLMGSWQLVFFAPSFSWLHTLPNAWLAPQKLNFVRLFNGFPPQPFFVVLDVLMLFALVAFTLGIRARLATFVYLLLAVVGFSFQFAFGKIDHYALPNILMGIMAFSGWGAHLALVPDKPVSPAVQQKCVSLAAVVVCFAFFTAGFEKALSWIDFNPRTSGFANWLYQASYLYRANSFLVPAMQRLPFHYFEWFDYAAVIFELSPLLFLLGSRRSWQFFLLLAVGFHVINTLVLNIPFLMHAIVFALFFNYSGQYGNLKKLLQQRLFVAIAGGLLTALVLLRLAIIFRHHRQPNIFVENPDSKWNLYVSLAVWLIVLSLMVARFIAPVKKAPAPRATAAVGQPLST